MTVTVRNVGGPEGAINRGDKAGAKSQLQSFIAKIQSNAGLVQ